MSENREWKSPCKKLERKRQEEKDGETAEKAPLPRLFEPAEAPSPEAIFHSFDLQSQYGIRIHIGQDHAAVAVPDEIAHGCFRADNLITGDRCRTAEAVFTDDHHLGAGLSGYPLQNDIGLVVIRELQLVVAEDTVHTDGIRGVCVEDLGLIVVDGTVVVENNAAVGIDDPCVVIDLSAVVEDGAGIVVDSCPVVIDSPAIVENGHALIGIETLSFGNSRVLHGICIVRRLRSAQNHAVGAGSGIGSVGLDLLCKFGCHRALLRALLRNHGLFFLSSFRAFRNR